MLEGVHFDLALMSPQQVGHKLVVVNVSDIYAMGGKPITALSIIGFKNLLEH